MAALREADGVDLGAADDGLLVERLARHARTVLGQRLVPSRVDRLWAINVVPRDVEAELLRAREGNDLVGWIARLEPAGPDYQALKTARGRYQAMVEGGGWARLPASPVLAPGSTHPAVPALRQRLLREGFGSAEPDGSADHFGPDLEATLKAFQTLHGLEPDARLGPGTRRALDVSAADRLAQIDANLERRRWLPRELPAERVELDLARQDAALYRDGRLALSMRVIVGKPSTKTPMFTSQLEAVILNPSWHVPVSIARGELWPSERRAPGSLARRGFVREGSALRQVPGPGNALGQLKFEMPSAFGVYLHDTPSRQLFARPERLLSHGCMRLERPRDLAAAVLGDQGWTTAKIDSAIAVGATRRIVLDRPVPLFVTYRTAEADGSGVVRFGSDPYRWDEKLVAALSRLPR